MKTRKTSDIKIRKREKKVYRQCNTVNYQGEYEMANWCKMRMYYEPLITSAAFSRLVTREDEGCELILLGRETRRSPDGFSRGNDGKAWFPTTARIRDHANFVTVPIVARSRSGRYCGKIVITDTWL